MPVCNNRRCLCILLLLGGSVCFLHAGGKVEEVVPEVKNSEWVFAVTALDVSALPEDRRLLGETLTRTLLESLRTVETRRRMDKETAYYREYAYVKQRGDTAKKLAAKRNERDQLIYQGDPDWQYRKKLKAIDAEITKLETEYVKAEGEMPSISDKPAFKFAESNSSSTFPAAPAAGSEYRFCQDQKADAFLAGTVSEFNGRLYVSVKMYTKFTRSYSHEDSVLFSIEDTTQAMHELADRLAAALSGEEPAFIAVHAGPEDPPVLINGAFAGRGEVALQEHPPGDVTVDVYADDYIAASVPLALQSGEIAELYINLAPLSRQALVIDVPGKPGTLVFRGSLYLGVTPLEVFVPVNGYGYFHVETAEGETGRVVVAGSGKPENASTVFDVRTTMPPLPAEKRVDKARKRFYGYYGAFWVILPAALLLAGNSTAYTNQYNRNQTQENYDAATTWYNVSLGAGVAAGVAAALMIYQAVKYVGSSDDYSTPPIAK
ncbi:hypothetical protein FACS1894147_01250 [Spirochaetia bacterium]|nr:hypothetical protein FACS1894147_01250 [Spirochaetia bacterium]